MNSSKHRVAITGIGLVTPVGNDVESTWSALLAGRSGGAPISLFDVSGFSTRIAAEVTADLCAYFHVISPYAWAVSVAASPSSQSTRFILRTTTNSSRLVPMVP